MNKQYPEESPIQLDLDGEYYSRHVEAMTAEGLHSKSDIAIQLGWRDREIDRLRPAVGAWQMGVELDVPGFLEWIADRMEHVHGENPYYDYMQHLRAIAKAGRDAVRKSQGLS